MQYKVKASVGFYQCIAAAPSVYNVYPPVGLEAYHQWINFFELPSDIENIFVPAMCLGDYRTQLLLVLGASWPVALVLVFAVGFVGWELLKRSNQTVSGTQGLSNTIYAGIQKVLPLGTGVTFLVVPSVSMRIFRSFLCDPIEFSKGIVRRYLVADLTLSCDSSGYETTSAIAYVCIVIWPVGIPLMYGALLFGSRKAINEGVPTSLSRATEFLWSDYTVEAWWWEPLEMCRKLILVGWVLVIHDNAEQARVLVAIVTSVAFLALRFAVKPLKRCGPHREPQ
jgi:hypothetical protein